MEDSHKKCTENNAISLNWNEVNGKFEQLIDINKNIFDKIFGIYARTKNSSEVLIGTKSIYLCVTVTL